MKKIVVLTALTILLGTACTTLDKVEKVSTDNTIVVDGKTISVGVEVAK